MTNAIILKRDNAGNYVIESDCWGRFITESQELALAHIGQLCDQQNTRINSLRKEPEKWTVKHISDLPS